MITVRERHIPQIPKKKTLLYSRIDTSVDPKQFSCFDINTKDKLIYQKNDFSACQTLRELGNMRKY